MDAIQLSNLVAYSAQLACVAALGGLLPLAIRIDTAAVRYAYWRGLLLLALALPWVQGRHLPAGTDAGGDVAVVFTAAALASGDPAAAALSWSTGVTAVLAGGFVVRLLWIAAGLARLRRMRRAGVEACADTDIAEAQRLAGASAAIRYVDAIDQPATFGLRRPTVLLPAALRAQPAAIRRAVLCHELAHVRRRDWGWLLAEELVRAAFWFHPAIWWLVSRVQLAREEAVDEEVVRLTGARRAYMQALLAFADDTPLAPAAAFGRRRHLFRRMVLISQEAAMSSTRIVLSCAVLALVVAAGSWMAIGAVPMVRAAAVDAQSAGPLEARARPITPENPVPRRVGAAAALYPTEAAASGAHATVRVRLVLDAAGRVAEARSLGVAVTGAQRSGLEAAFAGAALAAVRQWQYDAPAEAPMAFTVTLRFAPDADATLVAQEAPIHVAGGAPAPPPPPPPPPPPDWHQGALQVGGQIQPPQKVKDVRPVYPPEAKAAGVEGIVIIEARIDGDGRVSHTRVLKSIPTLDAAALDAVRQWEFRPTLLNGEPVPVVMTVTISFRLD